MRGYAASIVRQLLLNPNVIPSGRAVAVSLAAALLFFTDIMLAVRGRVVHAALIALREGGACGRTTAAYFTRVRPGAAVPDQQAVSAAAVCAG